MNNKNKFLLILTFLLISSMVFFGVLIFLEKKPSSIMSIPKKTSKPSQKEEAYPKELKGKVYLTARKKDQEKTSLYVFDLAKKSFKKIYSSDSNCSVLGGEVSSDNKMPVTVDCPGSFSQIKTIDLVGENKVSDNITNSLTYDKKEAVWSSYEDDRVIFMAFKERKMGVYSIPDLWEIYKLNKNGEEKFLMNGVHPFTSPDGKKILVLKKDGLTLLDIESNEEKIVHKFDKKTFVSLHMDLSDDKKKLAISNPGTFDITIFDIKSWDDFKMVEIDKIKNPRYFSSWPKFSSQNPGYLITEELSRVNSNNLKLVAYDLKTKKRHILLDLSEYEHNYLWVNDWK